MINKGRGTIPRSFFLSFATLSVAPASSWNIARIVSTIVPLREKLAACRNDRRAIADLSILLKFVLRTGEHESKRSEINRVYWKYPTVKYD